MSSMPDRYRRTLVRGALLYRWVALGWMTTLAASNVDDFRRPALAWASVGAAAAWTLWLTVAGRNSRDTSLWFDLALSGWLTLASGLVIPNGEIVSGGPFFASGYPMSTVLLWGVERGAGGGAVAGAVLSAGIALARPLNDVALDELTSGEAQSLAGTAVNYLVAGAAVGLVTRLLSQSAHAVEVANEQLVSEKERAARLAERESLARQIHDSVLQALALVHKRGRELARDGTVPGDEVERLAEVAGRQEAELRALILREPEEHPSGTASLRDALESLGRSIDTPRVSISTVGPLWLDRKAVEEITAALRQALDNIVEHAAATKASVFAEEDSGNLIISVRDDGVGFNYDEDELRKNSKAGMLMSMKGRIQDLGGTMKVTSAPGTGTEIEFVVPRSR